PEGHVQPREGVQHEWAAADVAVGAVDLLPEVLDPRRVFAVDQLVQGFDEHAGDTWVDRFDLAPADNTVVSLQANVDGRAGPVGAHAGELDGGGFVGHLGRGVLAGSDVVQQGCAGNRAGCRAQIFASIHREAPLELIVMVMPKPTRRGRPGPGYESSGRLT